MNVNHTSTDAQTDLPDCSIPFKKFNVDTLTEAIITALSPEVKEAAGRFGEQIRSEVRRSRRVTVLSYESAYRPAHSFLERGGSGSALVPQLFAPPEHALRPRAFTSSPMEQQGTRTEVERIGSLHTDRCGPTFLGRPSTTP
jgi:hypothetical protein